MPSSYPNSLPAILTAQEAAAIFRVCEATVYRRRRTDALTATPLEGCIRIRREALVEFRVRPRDHWGRP